jgi:hypothetical protein
MAQHDYSIANQGFPATRADINNVLSAIATNNSGTSAPSTQYAGQFWIDTTSSTWTLYIHDGADDIQFATIDTSANTVNFTDSALDVVTDTTPQLGGNLDLNSSDITGTGNINITGTVTATSFSGDGSSLTGIASDVVDDTTPQLGGDLDLNSNDITGTGNINITGNLTSTGIDDNATSTAIQINSSDQVILYGQQIQANNNTSNITYSGGNNSNAGANLTLFGGSHATTPNVARFRSSATEVMRIDSSGKVGIGTSSPSRNLHINASQPYLQLTSAATGTGTLDGFQLICSETDGEAILMQRENNKMTFYTNGTERVQITSAGELYVGVTSEPTTGDDGAQISNGSYHVFARNTAGSAVLRTFGSSGEFRTLGNGNAQNTNNSYGAISDRELKENEVDANSQWNDIKALQIKNYNLKSQPNQNHLGVIAQDLEASGMNGLVEQNQDEVYSENDVLPEGKNIGDVKEKGYKTVKYSILYMKAVKALQEAMTRIETLESEVTALKNQS